MTRNIGRYEILGPLATGGMAEILLARLVGPSGFERPVVIKRIRQDLDHDELEDLFLREARLAAKIRHANVVAVEDLGQDEGAPYLVMEYLEGESLSNVTRRLKSNQVTLPFGLVAYIISEACAGLHAAHELRDANDEPLGIVHRDVSPQNVFLTYDGAVKVVDFGIARSQGSPRSAPGEVRGKIGYLSPEQLRGDHLDRRTDVFALGIVLYECLTEHRLFKRFNAVGTMRAVLSDPIIAPRRIDPRIPVALDAICMRALSRPREERYATAAELRRELLVAMRDLVSEEPSAELAELMVRSFPDRIADKKELLRNVREGSVVDHIPVGDIDITIELPGLEDVPVGETWGPQGDPTIVTSRPSSIPDDPAAITDDRTSARRPRSRWPLGIATLVALGAVAFGMLFARGHRAVPPSRVAVPGAPSPSPTTSVVAPPAMSAEGASSAPRPEPTVAAPLAPSAAPAPSSRRPRPAQATTAAAAPPAASPAPTATSVATPAPSSSAPGFRRFQ